MRNSKEIIDIIKNKRLELNMSQRELAKQIGGISHSTISRYEKYERDFPINDAPLFAKALNIDLNYLLNIDSSSQTKTKEVDLHQIPGITVLNKSKRLPILGTIACGEPIFCDENFEGYFIADETIKADFILKAKGDSMVDAEIYDGDLVFIKKTPVVDNGKIAAVLIEDEVTLKKFIKTDNIYILQPCNIQYDPIVIKEDTKAMILGEAVGVYHVIEE